VAFLNHVLGLETVAQDDVVNIVVLQTEDRQFGLVVDGIRDTQEIVVKPLGKQLKGLTVYAGATIMGDGRVALILDILGIGQRSGVLADREAQNRAGFAVASSGPQNQRMLLFRAGSFARLAVPLSLVARLEEFPQSAVERAGGRYVVQYRGGILTLVSLASVLDPESPSNPAVLRDPVQAIVFVDGNRSLGIMVDQILDIVEESVSIRQSTKRFGLLGSAVVGKHVTDLLDLRAAIRSAVPEWLEAGAADPGTVVMLADPSTFLRGLARSELEMAGHRVVEAATSDQALSLLEGLGAGVVLAADDLPAGGCGGLREAMQKDANLAGIPVVTLGDRAECLGSGAESMLASIKRLVKAVAEPEIFVPADPVEEIRT
jgi:two-component system chemotaxis sensor kinase CheA